MERRSPVDQAEEIFRVLGGKRVPDGYMVFCPAHNDRNTPNLHVTVTDDKILFKCFADCSQQSVIDALTDRNLWNKREDTMPDPTPMRRTTTTGNGHGADTVYTYTDESGKPLHRTVRRNPKSFSQQYFDGKVWKTGLDDVRRVPYHLPDLVKAPTDATLFITEGEKDADNLAKLGLIATTNALGAQHWRPDYNQYFKKRRVVILEDHDKAGADRTETLKKALIRVAAAVHVVGFREYPEHSDVTDWLNNGGTKEALLELVERAPPIFVPRLVRDPDAAFMSMADFLDEVEEKQAWLVDGILPTGGFSVASAKPKVGKSVFVQNLAVTVAQGKSFLGRVTEKGVVLYAAFEEKRSEIRAHFRRLGATAEDPIFVYVGSAPAEALAWIEKEATNRRPALIILDTFQRFSRLPDLNDYAQVSNALEPVQMLARESGAHLLLCHHGNKMGGDNGDAVLGSTAIFGAVDTLIELRRGAEGRRTVNTIQRYGDDLPESVLGMDGDSFALSLEGTRHDVDERDTAESIVAFLEGCSTPQDRAAIFEAVEGRTGVKSEALRSLANDKRIYREGTGKRGSPHLYSISVSCSQSLTVGNRNTNDFLPLETTEAEYRHDDMEIPF